MEEQRAIEYRQLSQIDRQDNKVLQMFLAVFDVETILVIDDLIGEVRSGSTTFFLYPGNVECSGSKEYRKLASPTSLSATHTIQYAYTYTSSTKSLNFSGTMATAST